MPLSTGQILDNRYRIVKLLGQGGFGAVYRAWEMSLNVPCAVKENFDTSPEAVRQFGHEASILAGLRHPNLPRVTHHFTVPNPLAQPLSADSERVVARLDLGTVGRLAGGCLGSDLVHVEAGDLTE